MPTELSSGPGKGLDERDFLSLLQACLACGMVVVDERLQTAFFNSVSAKMLGLPEPPKGGLPFDHLPASLATLIRETRTTGDSINGRQLVLKEGALESNLIQVSTLPARVGATEVLGVVAVLNDVTSVRGWEANVQRMDRLQSVGTLSASMAHEVRNAFVAVRTFVELLLEKNQDADLAEIVRQEMTRIDTILSQMLKFSRTNKPAHSRVHLHAVIDRSMRLVQHVLEQKQITLQTSFAARPDDLEGDASLLEQAVINLCFNAADAMQPNGKLSLSTQLLAPCTSPANLPLNRNRPILYLEIRDNGAGIAPEVLEHIFEPFYTTKIEGTGLGLAITRRIIQDHGGVIYAQSKLGKGSTFSIYLPALSSPSKSPEPELQVGRIIRSDPGSED